MTYDAAIVGAGISGLNCASIFHLKYFNPQTKQGKIKTDSVDGTLMERKIKCCRQTRLSLFDETS